MNLGSISLFLLKGSSFMFAFISSLFSNIFFPKIIDGNFMQYICSLSSLGHHMIHICTIFFPPRATKFEYNIVPILYINLSLFHLGNNYIIVMCIENLERCLALGETYFQTNCATNSPTFFSD
jgi:hypothetical protein